MSHLKDQVGVVTGGSSGLGPAIAAALVAEGMAMVSVACFACSLIFHHRSIMM